MKCILHIGTEKTGTTSLQEFLHLNRERLVRYGYLYTSSAGRRNNWGLAVSAYNPSRRDSFTARLGIDTDRQLALYQRSVLDRLRRELRRAAPVHTVVFSSEHLQSRLTTEGEVARLRQILTELGFGNISVVVYLRAPEEIASSLYSTAVKHGATLREPPGPDEAYWRNVCDHRNTILRFRGLFGIDAVIPRLYGTDDLVNGSILDDFAQVAGIPYSEDRFLTPEKRNESMTLFGLEVLRRINRQIPVFDKDGGLNDLRSDIVDYIGKYLDGGKSYGMSSELQKQYQEAFCEGNEWVRVEYFPERTVLFGDPKITPSRKLDISAHELDRVAALIAAIWLDKSRVTAAVMNGKAWRLAQILWRLNNEGKKLLGKLRGG